MLTNKPIAIGADHRGFPLKEKIKAWLQAHDYAVNDVGVTTDADRVDAMDYALKLVSEIKEGRSEFAIAICGSGQMMAITANRFPFIRAALLHSADEAAPAREHGDSNILALGSDTLPEHDALKIVEVFLTTTSLGDRYAVRREKLAALDISKI
jgi:ribose 5-phosphate isomerase B